MAAAFGFLRSKGAFPEDDGDDSDDMIFGDDDSAPAAASISLLAGARPLGDAHRLCRLRCFPCPFSVSLSPSLTQTSLEIRHLADLDDYM